MKDNNIQPAISIIVPVYKAEKYLPDCINSILNQTFKDFELILVNDGSPDNSGVICDEFAVKDSRIKVIHKSNGGASSARNAGVEAAIGRYIGWVDADDIIDERMYEILYDLALEYKADIVECQFVMKVDNTEVRSGKDEPLVYGEGNFILHQFFATKMKAGLTTKIYKREIWEGIKFPKARIHQDCYVNMRFSLMRLKYVRIAKPLYYYLVRKNSITTTFSSREIREAVYLYEYTMNLSETVAKTKLEKKYLKRDAINRLMGRFFQVSVNSNLKNQYVYVFYIRRLLGFSFIKYILTKELPLKTRVSYILLILNLKDFQILLHNYLGKK